MEERDGNEAGSRQGGRVAEITTVLSGWKVPLSRLTRLSCRKNSLVDNLERKTYANEESDLRVV